jgi:hypothetical protein
MMAMACLRDWTTGPRFDPEWSSPRLNFGITSFDGISTSFAFSF